MDTLEAVKQGDDCLAVYALLVLITFLYRVWIGHSLKNYTPESNKCRSR